jgi:hypothetical protein
VGTHPSSSLNDACRRSSCTPLANSGRALRQSQYPQQLVAKHYQLSIMPQLDTTVEIRRLHSLRIGRPESMSVMAMFQQLANQVNEQAGKASSQELPGVLSLRGDLLVPYSERRTSSERAVGCCYLHGARGCPN